MFFAVRDWNLPVKDSLTVKEAAHERGAKPNQKLAVSVDFNLFIIATTRSTTSHSNHWNSVSCSSSSEPDSLPHSPHAWQQLLLAPSMKNDFKAGKRLPSSLPLFLQYYYSFQQPSCLIWFDSHTYLNLRIYSGKKNSCRQTISVTWRPSFC